MRMSCNGCRVLRKGCSESCSIRPCLDWIKNPDAQANATVFLAKFYGRAGLMNHINAGPHHLRPGIFRSLLYDACGRIVNPIYGSVGLLWSGSWKLCEEAVEAVLKGSPITPMESDVAHSPPLKAYDIRHVNKGREEDGNSKSGLNRVRTRGRFKSKRNRAAEKLVEQQGNASPSHESSLSEQRNESLGSAAEPSRSRDGEIKLELSLGWFKPVTMCLSKPRELEEGVGECNNGLFEMRLGLQASSG